MKIAVIGAGAMGSIYGCHLSLHHEVYMVDTSSSVVEHIKQQGIRLDEDGQNISTVPEPLYPRKT